MGAAFLPASFNFVDHLPPKSLASLASNEKTLDDGAIYQRAGEDFTVDHQPEFLVETKLPTEFLHALGIYHQTIVNAEITACKVIWKIEAAVNGKSPEKTRYYKLRKSKLGDLIKDLKKASNHLAEDHASALAELVTWINKYQLNRHMATHGAFSIIPGTDEFRIDYIKDEESNGDSVYREFNTPITFEIMAEALRDADRILRSLTALEKDISEGRVSWRA